MKIIRIFDFQINYEIKKINILNINDINFTIKKGNRKINNFFFKLIYYFIKYMKNLKNFIKNIIKIIELLLL